MKQRYVLLELVNRGASVGCMKRNLTTVEVPDGSYNFKFGFNEFENLQTLAYDVKQSYSRNDGSGFGGKLEHSEDVDLPEGKWEIFEIKPKKVILKRVG